MVYIEGGRPPIPSKIKDGHFLIPSAHSELRKGFDEFFRELKALASEHDCELIFYPHGGREEVFDAFERALVNSSNTMNVILVDSEGPVYKTPLEHLMHYGVWKKKPELVDCQCHLMVQIMESWFFADVQALYDYYGEGFKSENIPEEADVENIKKDDVNEALRIATKDTSKGEYKVYDTVNAEAEILKRLNLDIVRKKAPHCDRFFKTIKLFIIS